MIMIEFFGALLIVLFIGLFVMLALPSKKDILSVADDTIIPTEHS